MSLPWCLGGTKYHQPHVHSKDAIGIATWYVLCRRHNGSLAQQVQEDPCIVAEGTEAGLPASNSNDGHSGRHQARNPPEAAIHLRAPSETSSRQPGTVFCPPESLFWSITSSCSITVQNFTLHAVFGQFYSCQSCSDLHSYRKRVSEKWYFQNTFRSWRTTRFSEHSPRILAQATTANGLPEMLDWLSCTSLDLWNRCPSPYRIYIPFNCAQHKAVQYTADGEVALDSGKNVPGFVPAEPKKKTRSRDLQDLLQYTSEIGKESRVTGQTPSRTAKERKQHLSRQAGIKPVKLVTLGFCPSGSSFYQGCLGHWMAVCFSTYWNKQIDRPSDAKLQLSVYEWMKLV